MDGGTRQILRLVKTLLYPPAHVCVRACVCVKTGQTIKVALLLSEIGNQLADGEKELSIKIHYP